ncbi:glycosyltransferase family A protein [Blastomonas sp. AAP53]|uniref:glycosyltransferase family 2 protein n=1 Tax=Blastomonas sp. AAP53 TaxID=1248760 RepID=UPI00037B4BB9|nr:glycosyltransferase family A protein [Blastomonas sp. AAP53]
MTSPVVSVIMPAYNGAGLIGETIQSVLAQSFEDFELVIVDDCSTDTTWDVLQGYRDPRIRCLRAPVNGGPVQARNLAFSQARGRYIVGLDQDDLCTPDRFAQQVAFLDAHPDFALVASACRLLRDGREQDWSGMRLFTPDAIDWLLMLCNPLAWSSVMFRAEAARRLVPFERQEVLYAEDFDFYHRIRKHGRIARIDTPLLVYRCHPEGASKKYEDAMCASAARVLGDHYGAIFGERAQACGALVGKHLMHGLPVPDLSTLRQVADIMATLHRQFLQRCTPDAASRRIIDREYARLWWTLVRPALRWRIVSLRDVLPLRPACVPLALTQPDWLVSPLVGIVRGVMRKAMASELA